MKNQIRRSEVKVGEEFEWYGGTYLCMKAANSHEKCNHDTVCIKDGPSIKKGQSTKWDDMNCLVTVDRKILFKDLPVGAEFQPAAGYKYKRIYIKLDRDNLVTNKNHPGYTIRFEDDEEVII